MSVYRAELDELEARIYTIEPGSDDWRRVRELRRLDAETRIERISPEDVPSGSFVYGQMAKDGDRIWRSALADGDYLAGGLCGTESGDVLCFQAISAHEEGAHEWANAIASQGSRARAFIVKQ